MQYLAPPENLSDAPGGGGGGSAGGNGSAARAATVEYVDIDQAALSGATALIDASGNLVSAPAGIQGVNGKSVIAVIREDSKDPTLYDFSSAAASQSPYSQSQPTQAEHVILHMKNFVRSLPLTQIL